MTQKSAMAAGLLIGAAGAMVHMWLLRRRVERSMLRDPMALATYPLGLIPLALSVIIAAFVHPSAAWTCLVAVIAGRFMGLRYLRKL